MSRSIRHYTRHDLILSLWREQKGRCAYCDRPTRWQRRDRYANQHPRAATIDHRIPRSRGGTDHINNLVMCCYACNHEKDSMTETEFRRWRGAIMTEPRAARTHGDNGGRHVPGPAGGLGLPAGPGLNQKGATP